MLTGDYGAASFLFRAATELEAGDPLLGHSIHLTGSIARGDSRWSLEMVFDLEPDTALIGAPFALALLAAAGCGAGEPGE